jgi:hypothetical protein
VQIFVRKSENSLINYSIFIRLDDNSKWTIVIRSVKHLWWRKKSLPSWRWRQHIHPKQGFLCSVPLCPDRLWAHPTSHAMGTGGSFLADKVTRSVKLATHFQLVSRLRMRGAFPTPPPPWSFNVMPPNYVACFTAGGVGATSGDI